VTKEIFLLKEINVKMFDVDKAITNVKS